jgi:hypothetical protein
MDPPLVDQILPFFNSLKSYLTIEETLSALDKKLVAYPEVIRSLNDPSDDYVLLSFLKSPQGCYVKVRGTGNLESCKEKAKNIIQKIDSRLPIAIAKLGQWCFVTTDPDQLSKETIKIIDDKEITHKEHVNILIDEHEKKIKGTEEKNERVSTTEMNDDLNSYIRRKVMLYETYKQIEFLDKKLSLLKERQSLLNSLNNESSDKFENLWYEEYRRQLSQVGIDKTNITLEKISQIESLTPLIVEKTQLVEKLTENENNYNNLKYSSVDF